MWCLGTRLLPKISKWQRKIFKKLGQVDQLGFCQWYPGVIQM